MCYTIVAGLYLPIPPEKNAEMNAKHHRAANTIEQYLNSFIILKIVSSIATLYLKYVFIAML